jgi:metal-responsive CopG/Arc/MetJ family transcriptional regulator
MGRIRIVIPDELLEGIDNVVGPRGRSRFLETAAREKLDRLASEEAQSGSEAAARDAGYRPWRDRRSTAPTRGIRETDQSS